MACIGAVRDKAEPTMGCLLEVGDVSSARVPLAGTGAAVQGINAECRQLPVFIRRIFLRWRNASLFLAFSANLCFLYSVFVRKLWMVKGRA